MSWVFYFLAAFGVAYVLAAAYITLPFREWLAKQGTLAAWLLLLLECPACTGWHLGWLSIAFGIVELPRTLFYGLVLAFATAAVNLILARIAGLTKDSP